MTVLPSSTPPDRSSPDISIAELCDPLPTKRMLFDTGMTAIAFALTALALLPLLSVLISILHRGLPYLKWEVFTSLPAVDGFGNAILGTLIMVGIASIISIPIGIVTAIFLSEFNQGSALVEIVRFLTTILTGVPSIIIGVFAYGVIVLQSTPRTFSANAGGFALAILMLPIVALTTEQALKLVPQSSRLASAALGASRLQTTWRIVVATAIPAITTGVLLAIARAAGETAPLIFTALNSEDWPQGLNNPAPSLSVFIFNSGFLAPDPKQNQIAWTAALVLISLVLGISIIARLVTSRRLKVRG